MPSRLICKYFLTWKRHDWQVFLFLIVISHLFSNLHWKVLLFLFCQLTALLQIKLFVTLNIWVLFSTSSGLQVDLALAYFKTIIRTLKLGSYSQKYFVLLSFNKNPIIAPVCVCCHLTLAWRKPCRRSSSGRRSGHGAPRCRRISDTESWPRLYYSGQSRRSPRYRGSSWSPCPPIFISVQFQFRWVQSSLNIFYLGAGSLTGVVLGPLALSFLALWRSEMKQNITVVPPVHSHVFRLTDLLKNAFCEAEAV